VVKFIVHNFDLCDNFIEILITVHILCATLETTGMESLGSIPSKDLIPVPDTVWTKTFSEKKEMLEKICKIYCDEAYLVIYCATVVYHYLLLIFINSNDVNYRAIDVESAC